MASGDTRTLAGTGTSGTTGVSGESPQAAARTAARIGPRARLPLGHRPEVKATINDLGVSPAAASLLSTKKTLHKAGEVDLP